VALSSLQTRLTNDDEAGWLRMSTRVAVMVFAWSLPISLFGMQAALIGGALLLLWKALSGGVGLKVGSPLNSAILGLVICIALSLLLSPKGPHSFRTATSFWVVVAYFVSFHLVDSLY